MNKDVDFMLGVFVGMFIVILFSFAIINYKNNSFKKRCIEVKVGTYENGEFKYLDKNVEFIITGKNKD